MIFLKKYYFLISNIILYCILRRLERTYLNNKLSSMNCQKCEFKKPRPGLGSHAYRLVVKI